MTKANAPVPNHRTQSRHRTFLGRRTTPLAILAITLALAAAPPASATAVPALTTGPAPGAPLGTSGGSGNLDIAPASPSAGGAAPGQPGGVHPLV
jgi:hypothetical protein